MDDRMTITKNNSIPILTAAEGMMLTNGTTVSVQVFLGNLDSVENWNEVGEDYVLPDEMTEIEQKAAAYDILTGVSE